MKYIVQLNVAKPLYLLEAPEIQEFVDNLDYVNSLAEQSKGFIWRLKDDSGNATEIHFAKDIKFKDSVFNDENLIINLLLWDSVENLKIFLYKTAHADFMKKRKQWVEKMPNFNHVMWQVDENHIPSQYEAASKLKYLHDNGESLCAFSFSLKAS